MTHCNFSEIPIDQALEQNNKMVKYEGWFIGLADENSQLLRWMVAGPEIPRAAQSQELLEVSFEIPAEFHHHDQMKSVQKTIITQVKAFCQTLE